MVVLFLLICCAAASNLEDDPAGNQLYLYRKENPVPTNLTTSAGAAVSRKQATTSLNRNILTNEFLLESITQFVQQKIPERTVHAKGAGAFGYFEVTHDITDVCKSKLFSEIGKKTPVVTRFSLISGERGASDAQRGPRGLAIKFYTEDGNFDLLGLSFPVFLFKEPVGFAAFSRAAIRNAATNLADANALWDFLIAYPEGMFIILFFFGDAGIPAGYRYTPAFSVHTYQVVNQKGELHFIRFHVIPNAGVKTITSEEAAKITDPDYATRDLYNEIGKGDYPSWNISIQVLSSEDVKNATFDVFDVTKILPEKEYPLRPVGTIILNKNPKNYFAEVEQLALCPANYVDGMFGAPDKIFEARRLAYRAAHNYRLGTNFNNIPVNCPFQKAFTYNRDGVAPVNDNGGGSPNYFPNSFNGPQPYEDEDNIELIQIHEDPADNTEQVLDWYLNDMTEDEKSRLIQNIVGSLSQAIPELQQRAVEMFSTLGADLASRIEEGLSSTLANE